MKIIQSFWSKPCTKNKSGLDLRPAGGWLKWKYFLYSISLSCLKALAHYNHVELFTDELGNDLLIEKLKLPYTKVFVELDCINQYPDELWALGKIYSYSKQTEPFLHIDSDVFIWRKFDSALESSRLIAQNIEYNHNYYRTIICEAKRIFDAPEIYDYYDSRDLISSNAGIIGGTQIDFFAHFAKTSIQLIERNLANLIKSKNPGQFNALFEQFLFHVLAGKARIPIHYFYGKSDPQIPDLMKFYQTPTKNSFIHVIGSRAKLRDSINNKVETMIRTEYPAMYYKINSLITEFLA